jgi:putative RecB family exonuclease
MALPRPTSLSPSKVTSFKDCALAFRLSNIDRIPEPSSIPAVKGTVVHRALQLLFAESEPEGRTIDAALAALQRAVPEVLSDAEYADLDLDDETLAAFVADAETLLRHELELEDPRQVRVIGTELRLSVRIGDLRLTGIIDRLDLDDDGRLVVTDYKTGRAPSEGYEQTRLTGVHFYALLCEELFGVRPARIQLLHLREPVVISTVPTDQSLEAWRRQTAAVWSAVERACDEEDFRPRPGPMCNYCSYRTYCPAVGGDLDRLPSLAVPA